MALVLWCSLVPWIYNQNFWKRTEKMEKMWNIPHIKVFQNKTQITEYWDEVIVMEGTWFSLALIIHIIIVTIIISILTFFIICYFIFLFNILFTVTMFHDCIILICALRKLFTVKPLNMYKTINQFKSIIKKSIVGYSSIHIQLC